MSDGSESAAADDARQHAAECSADDETHHLPAQPLFKAGDEVFVRRAYPIGHCRTPAYFRGAQGVVERYCGAFANPEELAYGRDGTPPIHLYRVRARQCELWPAYGGSSLDTIEVEVFEHWLLALAVHKEQGLSDNRKEHNE